VHTIRPKDDEVIAKGPLRVNTIFPHRMSKLNTKAERFEILDLEVVPVPFLRQKSKSSTNVTAPNRMKSYLDAMQWVIPMHMYSTSAASHRTTYTV
jgi:hypothetical protein